MPERNPSHRQTSTLRCGGEDAADDLIVTLMLSSKWSPRIDNLLLMTGSIERMAELETNGQYFLAKPFRLEPFVARVIAQAGAPPPD
jgi:hypothetical protein